MVSDKMVCERWCVKVKDGVTKLCAEVGYRKVGMIKLYLKNGI